MRGIINDSKKQSLANEAKGKGVFDIEKKSKKKRKSKKVRRGHTCTRARRDLKSTNPSSSGWKYVTSTAKTVARDVPKEEAELVKVTKKESTTPVAVCEEVEDVSEVLFTTKADQVLEFLLSLVDGVFLISKSFIASLNLPMYF